EGVRHRSAIVLAPGRRHGTSFRLATGKSLLDRGVQRSDRASGQDVSGKNFSRLSATAVAGSTAERMGRRARSLRQRSRFYRLQRQPGRGRRTRAFDSVNGQRVVVSVMGKIGEARCAVYRARQRIAQSGDAPYQCVLHRASQFRRRRDSAIARVQGFSQTENYHSARRRRHSLSMEPPARHACERRARAVRRSGADNVLFATEMFGAVNAIDPKTGRNFEDLVPIFQDIEWLTDEDRYKITEGNAKKLFSRMLKQTKD